MGHKNNSYSRADFLILEYKLLVTGKIVPDKGAAEEHFIARLRKIKRELAACPDFMGELPCPSPDFQGVQPAAAEWCTTHGIGGTKRVTAFQPRP
jgi:hypothetical protein